MPPSTAAEAETSSWPSSLQDADDAAGATGAAEAGAGAGLDASASSINISSSGGGMTPHEAAASGSGRSRSSSSAPAATATATPEKIKVLLMGVGRAPRLAQSKFVVQARDPFRALYSVLRRLLQLRDDQALFLFVASSFSPGPEDSFGDLFRCFGKTGQLIVNYALDEAWG